MTKTDNMAEIGMHAFERAGLGKAPFRCIGVREEVFKATPDAPRQPGTCCDFCGTGIMVVCVIQDATGKRFKVGSDCVAKTGDKGLIKAFRTSPRQREMARKARQRADDRVIAEWDALWADPATSKALEGMHPCLWNGEPNTAETLEDNIKRRWNWSGAAGRKRNLKQLKAILANVN